MSATEDLKRLAGELYGDDWPMAVARFASVNRRNMQRIAEAAHRGEDYPASAGVLRALAEALAELCDQVRAAAEKPRTRAGEVAICKVTGKPVTSACYACIQRNDLAQWAVKCVRDAHGAMIDV
jgi:hypothetical protein